MPRPPPVVKSAPAWLLSFADLLSLILAFFVLLYSTTELHKSEFDQVRSSLNARFGDEQGASFMQHVEGKASQSAQEALPLDYLGIILQRKFTTFIADKSMSIAKYPARAGVKIAGIARLSAPRAKCCTARRWSKRWARASAV